MRRRFGKVLCDLAKNKIHLILETCMGFLMISENHKKIFKLRICEQSIIGVASGMAWT